VEYTQNILQYFDEYFLALREAQRCSSTMLAWGESVYEGRHMAGTLDVFSSKARPVISVSDDESAAKPKTLSLNNMTIDDAFGFDSILDDPRPSNSRSERYERRITNRQKFDEFDDIIEQDDETLDPDFTMAPKPPPKKGKGCGKGRGKSSIINNEGNFNVLRPSKSHVFNKSDQSEHELPDLDPVLSDDTPPLPNYDSDSNSITFGGLADVEFATASEIPQVLEDDGEESDSLILPGGEWNSAGSRNAVPMEGMEDCGAKASESPEEMDVDCAADDPRHSSRTLLIGDSTKQHIKETLQKSCGKIARKNSQKEKLVQKMEIPAEKFTFSKTVVKTIKSLFTSTTQSQEDAIQETTGNDSNRFIQGVETVRASDDHSLPGSHDMFSIDTQEFENPVPSPTFPGSGRSLRDTDLKSRGNAADDILCGNSSGAGDAQVTEENSISENGAEQKSFEKLDLDEQFSSYLESSGANVSRAPRPKFVRSHMPLGARAKRASQDTDDDELLEGVHFQTKAKKKPSVCRRKNVSSSATKETHQEEEDGENVMEPGPSGVRGKKSGCHAKKRKVARDFLLETPWEDYNP
jgi:hypothetical protein